LSEDAEKLEDFGTDSAAEWRRWDRELDLADKAEEDWRSEVKSVMKIYRTETETSTDRTGTHKSKSAFNILWSNVDTLRPALYNQTPKVNVSRRYKDEDALGKAISQVLERSIDFMMDYTDFDAQISMSVMDMLLPGRAISRVRYKPVIEGEVVTGESCPVEQVQWDDFRRGPGKTWGDIPWIAFKHKLTKAQIEDKFGKELAGKVHLDINAQKEEGADLSDTDATILKRGTVWEIWCKDSKKVKFLATGYKEGLLKVIDDPLQLSDFYPIPRPMLAVEDPTSIVPTTEYSQYAVLANELNLVTEKIIRITKALRYRGVYDGTLSELGKMFDSEDNNLVPLESATKVMDMGGLDKAIWIMPVEQLAAVLNHLYQYRASLIAAIYEVTGTSDIMRGNTEKSETATAQSIKSQWGSQRLQRRQREVQRYARDCIRIMSEIIAEKFSIETLKKMTGLKFPTMEEKQAVQMQMQMMQMQSQQQGQPPQVPEEIQAVLSSPTWEEIKEAMSQDLLREYKVDVETDSTIAGDIQEDRQNVTELLGGVVEFINGIAPAVEKGVVPIETAKALLMAGVRRFKLGAEVEDALDKIGDPKNEQPDPMVQQLQQQLQEVTKENEQLKSKAQVEMGKAQMQSQAADKDRQAEMENSERDRQADMSKAQMEAETKVVVAQIGKRNEQRTA
jgi:hypothetical protein